MFIFIIMIIIFFNFKYTLSIFITPTYRSYRSQIVNFILIIFQTLNYYIYFYTLYINLKIFTLV